MSTTSFEQCPVCASAAIIELADYKKDYLFRCSHCSFVFAQRIPSNDELISHYNTYPRGNSISAITIKRYNELLDKLERYRKTNNIIDVGCGDGFFLEVARQRKWNVYGTEYTDAAIQVCQAKGINMKQGKLNKSNYGAGFFDVITSFEVIEHINNPQEELQNFSYLLRQGGAVYVTTPNFNSLSRYYLKGKWNIIEYPEHLSYYTQKTLTYLFEQHNFKTIEFQTTGISFSRLQKSLGQTPATPADGVAMVNQDEALRSKTETKFIFKVAKKVVNSVLTLFQAGDTLKGIFVKI